MKIEKNRMVIAATFIVCLLAGCYGNLANQEKDNLLVEDNEFRYVKALQDRNARIMFDTAIVVKKHDPAAAQGMLQRAGYFAALQQNKTLFSEILAVEPSCAVYKHFIVKGKSKSPSLLPQICPVKSLAEVRMLNEDQLAQWDYYVAECYPQLSIDKLKNIIAQVNDARQNMNAMDLVSAVAVLSETACKNSTPEQLTSKGLLKEAMLLADISSDKMAMVECLKIAEGKNLLSPRELKEAKQTLRSMSATRAYRLNIKTKSAVRGKTVYHNGIRYTKIELADGTEIEIVDDCAEDQKRKEVKKLLSNENVNKMFYRLAKRKGMNVRFHIPPRNREVTMVVARLDALSRKSNLSFGKTIQAVLQLAESGNY